MTEELKTEKVHSLETARWITKEQLRSVENWVHGIKNGRALIRPDVAPGEVRGSYGTTVYEVEGEPMVFFNKVSKGDPQLIGWIFCSEKHAKELEQAGILNFPKRKLLKAKTFKF